MKNLLRQYAVTVALCVSTFPVGAATPLQIAQEAYLKASYPRVDDFFGWVTAISGDTIVVGALYEDCDATGVNSPRKNRRARESGAAYVFVRSGTNWVQQVYLKASNTDTKDQFGSSVAIAGDTIVIGAYSESSSAIGVNGNEADNSALQAGAAYVFVRNGTNWTQQAYLKASNASAHDLFGSSVAVFEDTIVVGAPGESSNARGVNGAQNNDAAPGSGAAYAFERTGTNWIQQAYLKASNAETGDRFGGTVAISGGTLVVGASWEDGGAVEVNGDQNDNNAPDSGAAYVFVRDGTNWVQQAYLKASNRLPYDHLRAVAISGDTIVAGAIWADGQDLESGQIITNCGGAYVFTRTGTNWGFEARLQASNPDFDDYFGRSVTISGDTIVVGANLEASAATGVNGDQSNNQLRYAGAAYVFQRSDTTWLQEAYLKASNTGVGDAFGSAVGMSGDTIVIGAIFESSRARGVNGNQKNNRLRASGAAYVFKLQQ